jgi:uncharacterized protein YceH (UPF0502 family)
MENERDSREREFEELDIRTLEERAAALNQKIADLERRLDEIGEAELEEPDTV